MKKEIESRLLTKSEAGIYLNVSRPVLEGLIKEGIIKTVPLVSTYRIDKNDLDSLIEALKTDTLSEDLKKRWGNLNNSRKMAIEDFSDKEVD